MKLINGERYLIEFLVGDEDEPFWHHRKVGDRCIATYRLPSDGYTVNRFILSNNECALDEDCRVIRHLPTNIKYLQLIAASNGRWGPLTQSEKELWQHAIAHDEWWGKAYRNVGPPKQFRIDRATCKHGV